MNCVQSPSLEWESTGKRASRVITIRLRLISTPVTVWFMAPVSPASKLQMSNTRKRDREGNRERQWEGKKGRGIFLLSISATLLFTPKPGENLNNDIFASAIERNPSSSHRVFCCSLPISGEAPGFWEHIWFYFVECSSLFRAVTLVWRLVHPETKELSTQTETAWHIPSHYAAGFLFFLFCNGGL